MTTHEPRGLVRDHFKADGTPKKRFKSFASAQAHAERYHHANLVIYQCSFCYAWHFATRRGRTR